MAEITYNVEKAQWAIEEYDRTTYLLRSIADDLRYRADELDRRAADGEAKAIELRARLIQDAARTCQCPCHQAVQPGLVPCPECNHSSR